jgi:hypothetical protein
VALAPAVTLFDEGDALREKLGVCATQLLVL